MVCLGFYVCEFKQPVSSIWNMWVSHVYRWVNVMFGKLRSVRLLCSKKKVWMKYSVNCMEPCEMPSTTHIWSGPRREKKNSEEFPPLRLGSDFYGKALAVRAPISHFIQAVRRLSIKPWCARKTKYFFGQECECSSTLSTYKDLMLHKAASYANKFLTSFLWASRERNGAEF